TTCSFDANTVSDNEIDYSTVTLNDFTFDVGNVSKTEFGYLDGVTSAIQTQIDSKLSTTTAASTYLTIAGNLSDLTSSSTARTNLGLGSVALLNSIDISDNTNFSVSATGLELSGDTLALSTGYTIPLTASTTEWATAYSWGDHSLAGYLTDITGESLESLSDVSAMTQATGDLLYWTGSGWGNIATSSLGIGGSLWSESGSDIYFNTGNVSVGTTSTTSLLTVGGDAYIAGNATTTGTLAVTGTGTSTFAGGISVAGSIIPSTDNIFSLGSDTNMWKDVFIGPGSLYINGKKVLEDVSDTITLSTDADQNLVTEATGAGSIITRTTGSGNININSDSGNVNIGTTGSGQLNLGTIDSGVWNGTPVDISGYTNFTVTANGLELSDDALALATGYAIPFSASTTEWATAYGWGDHSSGGYLTDLTGQSLESLSDVASFIQSSGDLLYWNGANWSNIATSSLGITGSNLWSENGSDVYFNTGNVSIGTTTSSSRLTIFETVSDAQVRIAYDATTFAELFADATGDLIFSASGGNAWFLNEDLYICEGGACPSVDGKEASTGNLIVENVVYSDGTAPITCPTGMVPVPPMPEVGMHNGFCVDKYEAKSDAGDAVSEAAGSPWVSITQYDARAQCLRAGKHLVTEQERLAIARNVEDVGWNWNGGSAGTNTMSDGHSDNSPGNALAADTTGDADDDPCVGTGQSCDISTWNSQRRTYQLSNGEYIWDFGGNVWEWTDEVTSDDYPVANNWSAWTACSTSGDGICGNTLTTDDERYGGNTVATRAFRRGGNWVNGSLSGAFTLYLGDAPAGTDTSIGFRCAR
ncbi:MAG: SUMF1/EgtB/PvdO family nonheme iron enzyme, partial [Candidatus Paceibacterota bacterium]